MYAHLTDAVMHCGHTRHDLSAMTSHDGGTEQQLPAEAVDLDQVAQHMINLTLGYRDLFVLNSSDKYKNKGCFNYEYIPYVGLH